MLQQLGTIFPRVRNQCEEMMGRLHRSWDRKGETESSQGMEMPAAMRGAHQIKFGADYREISSNLRPFSALVEYIVNDIPDFLTNGQALLFTTTGRPSERTATGVTRVREWRDGVPAEAESKEAKVAAKATGGLKRVGVDCVDGQGLRLLTAVHEGLTMARKMARIWRD